MKSQTRIFSI